MLLGTGSVCYKKKFRSRSLSRCEAGPHGCFETERYSVLIHNCYGSLFSLESI